MSTTTTLFPMRREPKLLGQTVVAIGFAQRYPFTVHIMTNTALTGATNDIDGGQQFIAA